MIFSKMKHQKEFNLYIKLKIQFLFGYSQNFHHICNAKSDDSNLSRCVR